MRSLTPKGSRLTPIHKTTKLGKPAWRCLCSCGKMITVLEVYLKSGTTKSCGCLKSEVSSAKVWKATAAVTSHGWSSHRLYSSWKNIRARCYNENSKDYPAYGGRGIRMVPEWDDFEVFRDWSLANGWEPGLTLDKIDNNKNYGPDNCKWMTRSENCKKQWIDRRGY